MPCFICACNPRRGTKCLSACLLLTNKWTWAFVLFHLAPLLSQIPRLTLWYAYLLLLLFVYALALSQSGHCDALQCHMETILHNHFSFLTSENIQHSTTTTTVCLWISPLFCQFWTACNHFVGMWSIQTWFLWCGRRWRLNHRIAWHFKFKLGENKCHEMTNDGGTPQDAYEQLLFHYYYILG